MSDGLITGGWGVGRLASPTRVMNSAQLIHFHLRDDIISMRRRPGEPIAEKDITQTYQVSRTPVREALLRLSEEGLIDIIAKSGTIVSRIPADELPEAILARKAIEQMTARMAAELAARSDVLKLRAIVERQKEALRSNDIDGFHDEDEALHRSIMAAAGLPGIWRFVEGIKVQLDRFRRLTLPQAHRMERALAEHVELVDAIGAGQSEKAATVIGDHLDWLGASLAKIRDIGPDYFSGNLEDAQVRWGRRSPAPAVVQAMAVGSQIDASNIASLAGHMEIKSREGA